MPAQVVKIRSDDKSTPETILGMLLGHRDTIKHIVAVVIWDDDSYQMVNDSIALSEHAFAIAMMQRALFREMD